ncbi:hypothetical protein OROMI_010465 [Orobanche minor]
MSIYIQINEDAIVGAIQKRHGLWVHIKQVYDQCPIENLNDLNPRNMEQMKSCYKRLSQVFEKVMCKYPKWNPGMQADQSYPNFTYPKPSNNVESGRSTKRIRTTKMEIGTNPDDPPTPVSRASTIERPGSQEAAKKMQSTKGKEKITSSNDGFPAELGSLQLEQSQLKKSTKNVFD